MTANKRTLVVDEYEFRALIAGLRRLRGNTLGLMRRDERQGWRPEAGKADVQKLRLATIEGLLSRYVPELETTEG